jgi:periplasmic protein TonB
MFEDSLVDSAGRIRTRSKWFTIASFLFQAAILAALILIPFLHPAALPRQALTTTQLAPPPPPSRPDLHARTTAHAAMPTLLTALAAPRAIPQHPAMVDDSVPGPLDIGGGDGHSGPGVMDALPGLGTPPTVLVKPEPKPRPGPLRISAGVAAGHLIVPIRHVYPAIARNARIQGTVVVEATISTQGLIEHARVVSGAPMLASAALNAIAQAQYEPYRLNGDPVEVETTINVVFRLNE